MRLKLSDLDEARSRYTCLPLSVRMALCKSLDKQQRILQTSIDHYKALEAVGKKVRVPR